MKSLGDLFPGKSAHRGGGADLLLREQAPFRPQLSAIMSINNPPEFVSTVVIYNKRPTGIAIGGRIRSLNNDESLIATT